MPSLYAVRECQRKNGNRNKGEQEGEKEHDRMEAAKLLSRMTEGRVDSLPAGG